MFIYEHNNWTDFTWDQGAIAPLLSEVRFNQGKLLGRIQDLGFSLDAELELNALTQETIASSRIEGVVLDEGKVRSSLARSLGLPDENPLDTRDVDGAVSIMVDASRHFSTPMDFDRLTQWHRALFPHPYSGMSRIHAGEYRTGAMSVVSGAIGHEREHYRAPDAREVPALMKSFLSWINESSTDDSLLKAGMAHLRFLTIHPFDDGNGRIARALTEMLLARSDQSPQRFYSMARFILAHRNQYYQALEHAQHGTPDITGWLHWFLNALLASIAQADESVEAVTKRDAWWRSVDGVSLNDRQRAIIQRLLTNFEGKLTTTKWAKLCKVSQDTALRDINDLVAKGVLESEGAGGRSTAYRLRLQP